MSDTVTDTTGTFEVKTEGATTYLYPTAGGLVLDGSWPYGFPGCTNGPSSRGPAPILIAGADTRWILDHLDTMTWDAAEATRYRETVHRIYYRLAYTMVGGVNLFIEPVEPCPPGRVGYMAGGNTADVGTASTSREMEVFDALVRLGVDREYLRAVRIHDRSETPEQYDRLSR